MQVPELVNLIKFGVIVSSEYWFTARHIGTGGNDKTIQIPVRRTIVFITQQDKSKARQESHFTSAKASVNCLSKPLSQRMRRNVRFYKKNSSSIMIQPTL